MSWSMAASAYLEPAGNCWPMRTSAPPISKAGTERADGDDAGSARNLVRRLLRYYGAVDRLRRVHDRPGDRRYVATVLAGPGLQRAARCRRALPDLRLVRWRAVVVVRLPDRHRPVNTDRH